MNSELLNSEVLAMYDVRGIQSYIFKSNKAKEIIGASELVADVIIDGLHAYVQKKVNNEQHGSYMTDWMNDSGTDFLKDDRIQMQVMFVGGGNAYVLFRKGEICQQVNRFLAKYIMEHTYSLNLAVAVIAKTDSYKEDYRSINDEMRRIKSHMPCTQPVGALPFMEVDSISGYPLTKEKDGKYYSTEADLKRASFPIKESERVFDRMVTEKGDNSMLAVCHIDGNSMGSRIKNQMSECIAYDGAIKKMRGISLEIAKTFRNMFDQMTGYMDILSEKVKSHTANKLYREIIVAGDDITFVCNAKLAIPAVNYFLKHIGDQSPYSACGGIAFFNSHFPFSDAYQVAEACCDSAKHRAKESCHRGNDEKIGNYFDFQICTNISAAKLGAYRKKHYMSDGKMFLARPYYVPIDKDEYGLNEKNKNHDVHNLQKWEKYLCNMPRNKAKLLRNSIPLGIDKREETVAFLQSRGYTELKSHIDEYAIWYDATEIMDLYIDEVTEDED